MLKRICALVCLFLFLPAFAQSGSNATLTGVITDSANTVLANGSVTFALANCGGAPTGGTLQYGPFTLDANGNITGTVVANASNGCPSAVSYYQVTADDSTGNLRWRRNYVVTAGTYDLATATPLVPLPQSSSTTVIPVPSVFGRTGAIEPQANDYSVSQIAGLLDFGGHIQSTLIPSLPESQITSLVSDLGNRVNKNGDTMLGALNLSGDPTTPLGAATKQYVDAAVADVDASAAGALPITGGTMLGNLVLNADPTGNLQAATKQYVDSKSFTAPGNAGALLYNAGSGAIGSINLTGLLKGNGASAPSAAASSDVTSTLGYTPVNKAGDVVSGTLQMLQALAKGPRVDVNHSDFGAVSGCANAADRFGVQDSTCAFNAAFAYAAATRLGVISPSVYIPAGTYKLSGAIRVPCSLHVWGDGMNATILEPTNNTANGLTIIGTYTGATFPNEWSCNGTLSDLAIHSPNSHLYQATLLELHSAVGYKLFRVRLSNGGGRGFATSGSTERVDVIDSEIDTVRWPIFTGGNEMHFYKTNIASPGETSDSYCWGSNCVNGVSPSILWTGTNTLQSATADGTTATFVVTCAPAASCVGGKSSNSPIVAGHWFKISGIPDVTGLNGFWQATSVTNNSPAGSFTITAASTATGTATVTGAIFQPSPVPEINAAVHLSGFDVEFNGGSIKANWYTSCFKVTGSQEVSISNMYCEGFPENGMPRIASDLIVDGVMHYTYTTAGLSGSCTSTTPCSVGVTGGSSSGALWQMWFTGDWATDGTSSAGPLNIYPPDYNPTITTPSAFVSGVNRNQFETVTGVFSVDGNLHIYARNVSGSTVTITPAWPSNSIIANTDAFINFGPQVTATSNHFESLDGPGNSNWAAYCNDSEGNTSVHSCASYLIGQIPDGVVNFPMIGPSGGVGAGLPSTNVLLINDEILGVGGAANEALGGSWVKVHSRGSVVIEEGSPGTTNGETSEVLTGQVQNYHNTPVVAVQYSNGYSSLFQYNNLTEGKRLTTPMSGLAPPSGLTNGWFEQDLWNPFFGDPVLGTSPGINGAVGHQYATVDCWYDVPPSSLTHATNRWCQKGGPGFTGTGMGFEHDIWNATTNQWVSAFSCHPDATTTTADDCSVGENLTAGGNFTATGVVTGSTLSASTPGSATAPAITFPSQGGQQAGLFETSLSNLGIYARGTEVAEIGSNYEVIRASEGYCYGAFTAPTGCLYANGASFFLGNGSSAADATGILSLGGLFVNSSLTVPTTYKVGANTITQPSSAGTLALTSAPKSMSFVIGDDGGTTAITTSNAVWGFWKNEYGVPVTVTEVDCYSNDGTGTATLGYGNGSASNAGTIVSGTACSSTGTSNAVSITVPAGDVLNFVPTGGSSKRISVMLSFHQ